MSQVLARFSLTEVTRIPYYSGQLVTTKEATKVRLAGVKGEPFGPATPSANLEMVIVNPDAAQVFQNSPIGSEFNVLISPVNESS